MEKQINREAYLKYAKSFTGVERQLKEEFEEWLPETIIDCHAHSGLPEHIRKIDESVYGRPFSAFPSFTLEESKEWHVLLHPGKTIRTLRFPMAFRGIDHKAANIYLLTQSPKQDRIALYGLPNDPEYTIGMLGQPRVSALKMYYCYLDPPATEIYQYFSKIILEVAQSLGIPIILHLPKKITDSYGQILQLVKDFPNLKICLAHLGSVKYPTPGLEQAFSAITHRPLISLDTSLISSSDVISMALRIFDSERVMYGSDEPLNLMRFVIYEHPRLGDRLTAEYPYHWLNLAEYKEFKSLAAGATHAHWKSLYAIKSAIGTLRKNVREETKQKIFHNNAKHFFGKII